MGTTAINYGSVQSRIAEWARLMRLHTVAASAVIMYIGYITVEQLNIVDAGIIFALSAVIHTSGCILNDYYDYTYDKDDPGKLMRPLVRGEINPQESAYVGYFLVCVGLLISSLISIELLAVSIFSTAVGLYYNIKSKDNVISEFAFASWESSLAVMGAVIAGGFSRLTLLFTVFMFIQALFQIQEGSMKDLPGDEATLLDSLGVHVHPDGTITYPRFFKSAVMLIKAGQLGILYMILVKQYDILSVYQDISVYIVSIALVANAILFIWSTKRWMVDKYDRSDIVESFTVHELSGVMLACLVVLPRDPVYVISLLMLVPTWVIGVNVLIHSGLVNPDI